LGQPLTRFRSIPYFSVMSQGSTPAASAPCPSCGTPASGKFCGECGAALLGVKCTSCSALLTPGALFCHRCGVGVGGRPSRATAAAATSPSGQRSIVPWVLAGAALLALVIMVASQQASAPTAASGGTMPLGTAPAGRAPDISAMSPRERADRLFDRVMNMSAQGKTDSAAFFASMAVGAYESVGPLDLDLRYDYGRMAEMSGDLPLAQSQADTILQENPDHLLGLILAARVAQARNDEATANRHLAHLARAEKVELAKSLDEYVRHRNDIDAAIALTKK
jgi:hypothetical protein